MTARRIAIVGGGYSGTLLALNLFRYGDAEVILIERGDRPARGAAYSTTSPLHLLNVRAGRMSAFADAPDHFARWLEVRGEGDAESFAQRRIYGAYLEALLREAESERLRVVRGEAADIVRADGEERIMLVDGTGIAADVAVLAVGNLPPEVPRGVAPELGPDVYVADPWRGSIAADLAPDDRVLLIGTGLTAVDAVLTLDEAGFAGEIVALSRRGLVPRAHDEVQGPVPPLEARPQGEASTLLRQVRRNGEEIGWQAAVDRLRPHTQKLWADGPLAQRRRFLRHLRPWWDVHRHRIAPEIAQRIEALEREGRLRVAAGKLVSAVPQGAGACVTWRPRGREEAETMLARRIVNCTGPRGDVARSGEKLLESLVAQGRIRPDPCRIGIDIDEACHAIGADGAASDSLYAIGPMTRGALWEIVAVPDLRVQTDQLAKALSA